MSRQVPLHELERAKKIQKITDKTLAIGRTLAIVVFWLAVALLAGLLIWGVWASHGVVAGICSLVAMVATMVFGTALVMNETSRTKIKNAKFYGVIDE